MNHSALVFNCWHNDICLFLIHLHSYHPNILNIYTKSFFSFKKFLFLIKTKKHPGIKSRGVEMEIGFVHLKKLNNGRNPNIEIFECVSLLLLKHIFQRHDFAKISDFTDLLHRILPFSHVFVLEYKYRNIFTFASSIKCIIYQSYVSLFHQLQIANFQKEASTLPPSSQFLL